MPSNYTGEARKPSGDARLDFSQIQSAIATGASLVKEVRKDKGVRKTEKEYKENKIGYSDYLKQLTMIDPEYAKQMSSIAKLSTAHEKEIVIDVADNIGTTANWLLDQGGGPPGADGAGQAEAQYKNMEQWQSRRQMIAGQEGAKDLLDAWDKAFNVGPDGVPDLSNEGLKRTISQVLATKNMVLLSHGGDKDTQMRYLTDRLARQRLLLGDELISGREKQKQRDWKARFTAEQNAKNGVGKGSSKGGGGNTGKPKTTVEDLEGYHRAIDKVTMYFARRYIETGGIITVADLRKTNLFPDASKDELANKILPAFKENIEKELKKIAELETEEEEAGLDVLPVGGTTEEKQAAPGTGSSSPVLDRLNIEPNAARGTRHIDPQSQQWPNPNRG